MIKAPIGLQDLRRSLYVKAKAEPSWRFWGLYVHVCKVETWHEAYRMAKANDGAPGSDGVTFEAIEESGVDGFLTQIRDELITNTYQPMRARKKEIPKDGGKVRVLSIPAIRDRVVQGALKLILEPIFEADFQSGSYGYRPKRTAHQAVNRVAQAIVESKTRIIDIDLSALRADAMCGTEDRRSADAATDQDVAEGAGRGAGCKREAAANGRQGQRSRYSARWSDQSSARESVHEPDVEGLSADPAGRAVSGAYSELRGRLRDSESR